MEIKSSTNGNGLLNGNVHIYKDGIDSASKSKLIDQVNFKYNRFIYNQNFFTINKTLKNFI